MPKPIDVTVSPSWREVWIKLADGTNIAMTYEEAAKLGWQLIDPLYKEKLRLEQ